MGNGHTADGITGGRIDDLVDPCLQGFCQRGANVEVAGTSMIPLMPFTETLKMLSPFCRQFEDIGSGSFALAPTACAEVITGQYSREQKVVLSLTNTKRGCRHYR